MRFYQWGADGGCWLLTDVVTVPEKDPGKAETIEASSGFTTHSTPLPPPQHWIAHSLWEFRKGFQRRGIWNGPWRMEILMGEARGKSLPAYG